MTVFTRSLALGLTALMFAACSSRNEPDRSEVTTNQETPKETMREGWQNIKQGTSDVAQGVGEATKNAAHETGSELKEAGQEMKASAIAAGQEIKASACPVVGSQVTHKYYTQTHKDYNMMLKGEKVLGSDKRECFHSERAALDDGYTKAR